MDNKDIRLLKQMEDSAVSMPEMTKKSEYTKQQIHYRLNEKFGKYVQKDSETENPGAARSTTVWTLSEKGQEKIESESITDDENTNIETFDDLAAATKEASQNAESAKQSVQRYRKKVSRIDDRITYIKDSMGSTWGELEDGVTVLTGDDRDHLEAEQALMRSDLDSIEADLNERIANVRENINNIQTTLSEQSKHISILDERASELLEENNELNQRVEKQSELIKELEDRVSELEEEDEHESNSIIEQLADLI